MDVNNQGLNLPSNLQNLDVRNELLSSEVGSGASCAYSLRDLTGSNKKVVRVRRTPNDTTNSIDDERIFGSQEVQAGYVEDWVNGKLETALPCNVGTNFTNGSFVVSDSSSSVVNGTYTFNSSNSRWERTSTIYFHLDGSTWKLEVGNSSISATTSGDYPWTSIYSLTEGNISFGIKFSSIDFSTASAGYSLRKIKSSYSGNAIQIRRSSDQAEVDVAFDSEGKVSNNSLVTDVTEESESGGTQVASSGATTLGDFISGTDAFVVTWYDQAGSNDAVQLTSANQPQIASSGALLADGLLFDDSNDFLQSSTQVLTGTGNNSLYCVVKTLADNGYIAGSAGTGVGMSIYAGTTKFILSNNNSAGTTAQDTIPMVNDKTVLVSANFDDGTTDSLHLNASAGGYANGSSAYSITAGTKFTIGARDGSSAEAVMYKGSIQEIIAYDSFQGANRFKIESNINNYYGLYNDANEMAEPWTSPDDTVTNESKDGFTVTNPVSGDYAFVELAIPAPASTPSHIRVSFNANDPDGALNNISVRQSENGVSGSTANITNGFNSINVSNNAGGTGIGLQITFNAGTATATLSDFKVSRIARNGFVETWYDQSTNQRDAIQGTATNQPSIVQNGGIVKVNSKPTITFDGNDNFLEVDGTGSAVAYSFSPSGDFGMFIVSKQSVGNVTDSRDAGGDGIFLQQASANTTRFRYNASANNIDVTATRDAQHYSTMILDGTTLSGSVDGGTAVTKTVTAGVSTTKNLVLGKAFSGNNSNFLDGKIQEAIFYENSKASEKSEIETDIDNFYSIT